MKIALLSDWETQGGAAKATTRLAAGLAAAGHEVVRLIGCAGNGATGSGVRLLKPSHPMRHQFVRKCLPSTARTAWDQRTACSLLNDELAALKPDVINVHNLHAAAWLGWTPELVRVCGEHAPVVWTLHDMWSFTGRCAFNTVRLDYLAEPDKNFGCTKFISGCNATCPTPHEYPSLVPERIAGAWEERRQLFESQKDLQGISPSRWLADEAKQGLWRERTIHVIPYDVPLDVFSPVKRELARKALGIHTTGPVLMLAAQNVDDKRKGGRELIEALKRVRQRPLTVLSLGTGALPLADEGIHYMPSGHIDHERTIALAFNASDVLVHPALADNLPNVVLEAMATGTPTVAFRVGGLPEMVRPGLTGWLAKEPTAESLVAALETALDDLADGRDLRASCRAVAEAEYGMPQQAKRYVELFESVARIQGAAVG
ncbi:MAG: glycosyltransferase [Verrucomicrobiota bacterium]